MKLRVKNLTLILCFLVLFSCATQHTNNLKKTDWLIGTWENKTPKGSIYETWGKKNDNELLGKSYIVKEQDTVVFENIRIVQEQDGLFYIPTVKNQNDSLPVRFIAKSVSETRLIFENPKHDFPQLITYTKISKDSLNAEILGITNGKKRKQAFPMQRIK